jgi:hypothetical protein
MGWRRDGILLRQRDFRAGAEKLVRDLKQTPQQKLEALKAGESGLEIDKAAFYRIPIGDKLDDANLTVLEKAFDKDGKTYERLPILDDKGYVQACLHISTLTKYFAIAKKESANEMILGGLVRKLKWKPENNFGTVSPTDKLNRAKDIINATNECKDVFVTADGTKSKRADR